MRTIPRLFAILALALAFLSPAIAQVRFEVASIHPSQPGATARDGRFMFSGDSFDAQAATVSDLLDMLNGWQLMRVVGGPAWMTTDRYDIHAKAAAAVPNEAQKEALMALLAERFQLSVHHETRDIPAVVLLAPKNPAAIQPAAPGERPSMPYNGGNPLKFTAVTMSAFTNFLSQTLQSPIVDQTGLTAAYDFTLDLSTATSPGENWRDSVRDALLAIGFKLEERKTPVDITVVDRCERPSEN